MQIEVLELQDHNTKYKINESKLHSYIHTLNLDVTDYIIA